MKTMGELYVAGIVGECVSEETRRLLSSPVPTIVCSRSTQAILKQTIPGVGTALWLSITPVQQCLARMRERLEQGPIVIIATGDPLFFGLGRLLQKTFPAVSITFLPALSTMQLCFARFGMTWDDAEFLSLHGRSPHLLEQKLQAGKLFIFTDQNNSPSMIARFLLDRFGAFAADRYRIYVGERLATSAERLITGTPEDIAGQQFHQPNCLILFDTTRETERTVSRFGLKEADFFHSRGLITKNEVRAAVLHTLALPDRGVLWDVGAGSGSVGIEAARLFPSLSVYSIEKEAVRIANIRKNRERFRCWNLMPVEGQAPAALHPLPLPDRVFIGGSGGNLELLLRFIAATVGKQAIIVLTAVRAQTRSTASALLHEHGYRVSVSRISISRQEYPNGTETRLNPIDVIRAEKIDG